MGWIAPSDSKKAVKKAGERIRHGEDADGDLNILNRWRAAHGYIINTFQANLRQRTRGTNIQVGQRLKRANTIIDKLRQGRALDLSSMHDIAGMRLVFSDIPSLNEFRASFHLSRAKHEMINAVPKYDYIAAPKESGYRGIHDVYKYKAGTLAGAQWNGLLIELQYRTIVQHAWATAVELSDVLTANRVKFSQGEKDHTRFFQICSELLARKYENSVSCLPDMSHRELVDEWSFLEGRSHIFRTLGEAGQQGADHDLKGFILLVVPENGSDLRVERHRSYRSAWHELLKIEREQPTWDVVLVGGSEGESLKSTFRNYFRNATEFIQLVESAL